MIAKRLKTLIDEQTLSARAISLACDFQHNTIGYFLKGSRKPTSEQLIVLSKHFSVSADYILGISKERNPSNSTKALKAALDLCKYTEERLGAFDEWDAREAYINELAKYLSSNEKDSGAEIIAFSEKAYAKHKKAA